MDTKDIILEKIKELENKLEVPDLADEDIDKISAELDRLMEELQKEL